MKTDEIRYTQKIKNDSRLILKQIILSVCIVALLVIIAGVVACLGAKKYYDLIWYAIAFVVVILIQWSTVFLVYTLIIQFDCGRLRVSKSYGGIIVKVFDVDAKDVIAQRFGEDKYAEKVVALVPKGCAGERFVVKLSGKNYLLIFDDYLYSLIEVARDIS